MHKNNFDVKLLSEKMGQLLSFSSNLYLTLMNEMKLLQINIICIIQVPA